MDVENWLRKEGDPVRGWWAVNPGGKATLWVDASNMALGVALDVNGEIIEDASWLHGKNDSSHINLAELDAVLKGIGLARKWGMQELVLVTDSATVFGWLKVVVHKTHNVRTKALSELLIRRHLDILKNVIAQEQLTVAVRLVRSHEN